MSLVKKHSETASITQIEHRQRNRDLDSLLNQLCNDDPRTRRWAAHDMADYPKESVKALCGRLKIEMDMAVRESILSTLQGIGNEETVENLIAFLRSEDAALRFAVVEVLQKLPLVVMNYMEEILHDPDKDIRILSVTILRDLSHPKTEEWLLNVIQNDIDVNVAGTAVDCISEIGEPDIVPELLALKDRFSGEPYIEFAVDTAIRRIEGHQ